MLYLCSNDHKKRPLLVAFLPLSVALCSPLLAQSTPHYTVTAVNLDSVTGINDKGQIVGTINTAKQHKAEDGPYMDFAEVALWQAGKIRIVGTYLHQPDCTPAAINNQGEVVVRADKANHFPGDGDWSDIHLAWWKRGRFFPLTDSGEVLGMNDRGQAVGFRTWPDGQFGFAAWHGRVKEIRNPLNGKHCDIAGINNAGLMVGNVFGPHLGPLNRFGSDADRRYAYLWPLKGKPFNIETLHHLVFSEASGINNKGQVIGYVNFKGDWFPDQGGRHIFYNDHAFVWYQRKMTLLDQKDINATRSTAINDAGDVIGEARFPAKQPDGSHRGLFLYQNGILYNLNALLSAGSHWDLQSVSGMNNRGQIIGSGLHDGKPHAFLLTPITQ